MKIQHKCVSNNKKWWVFGLMLTLVLSAGCAADKTAGKETAASKNTPSVSKPAAPSKTAEIKPMTILSLDEMKAGKINESGEIMVIMYHALGKKNAAYVRTPESFASDLQVLYDKGFRPISMKEYIQGRIAVEKGKTPVVLTFDDGNETNLKFTGMDAKGQPILDPKCNVAIMEAFSAKHPDFKTRAIFFLNGGEPFAQKGYGDQKVRYLLSRGMEIGNHSSAHENFSKLSGAQVETSLGKDNVMLLGYLKKAFAAMNEQEKAASVMKLEDGIYALALPFGSRPPKAERGVLPTGSYEGVTYHHQAILNVGWKPEVAPTNSAFNAQSINRVQSGDGVLQLSDWLKGYDQHPERRYISDGNPDTLAVPNKLLDRLDAKKAKAFKVIGY